jgi:hypothetical protein
VLRNSSDDAGDGAFVRDCRGLGRMRIMCKFGIVDYKLSGEYEGSKGSEVKGRGRHGGESEERRRMEEKG